MCGGKDRASPDLLLIDCKGPQCGNKKTILYTQTNRLGNYHLEKNPIDTSGKQWILDQFQGVGQ